MVRQGARLVIVGVLENELKETSKVIWRELLAVEADVTSNDQVLMYFFRLPKES